MTAPSVNETLLEFLLYSKGTLSVWKVLLCLLFSGIGTLLGSILVS
jgi:hypothetical protein